MENRANALSAEVVCFHNRDRDIIPLRIRIVDEDGETKDYKVMGYNVLGRPGIRRLPNHIVTRSTCWEYSCKIVVLGKVLIVQLFYNTLDNTWSLVY